MFNTRGIKFHLQYLMVQNRDVVLSFVSSVIQSFLIRNGFASQKPSEGRPLTHDGSPSPHKKRKIILDKSQDFSPHEPDQRQISKDFVTTPPPPPLYSNPVRTLAALS